MTLQEQNGFFARNALATRKETRESSGNPQTAKPTRPANTKGKEEDKVKRQIKKEVTM